MYLALLRRRPRFRTLWLAQVISLAGDWFNTIAAVILVSRYMPSGVAVSALFIARALPPFILGPAAGVVADRFNRKWVLIASDLLRAVIVLGYLFVNSAERAWLLFALSILQFSIASFFEPARAAITPNLVASDELIAANTLSSATWSAMLAFGAAIGGFTAAMFGTQVAIIVDALSFVLSALCLFTIPYQSGHEERPLHTSGLADFIGGLQYIRKNPGIGLVTLVKAMGQVGSTDIVIAVYAARIFHIGQDGSVTLGLMFAAFGMGAVAGPFIGNALGVRTASALHRAIGIGFLCIPIGWLALARASVLPVALFGIALRGAGASVNWTYSDVLLQMKTPDHFMGRVFAFDLGLFTLAMSASLWLSGAALDRYSMDPHRLALAFAAGSLVPLAVWVGFVLKRML